MVEISQRYTTELSPQKICCWQWHLLSSCQGRYCLNTFPALAY